MWLIGKRSYEKERETDDDGDVVDYKEQKRMCGDNEFSTSAAAAANTLLSMGFHSILIYQIQN